MRSAARAENLRGLPAEVVEVNYADAQSLEDALKGARGVAHLAGALVPRSGDSLAESNLAITRNVVEASLARGVERFVYLSFPGADPDSSNEYLRTKGQAEALVRQNFTRGAVFRVPMILGADTPAVRQMHRLTSAALTPLVAGGRVRIQPVYVGDVVRAIEWALLHTEEPLRVMHLLGPDTLPYADLLRRAGRRLGRQPRIVPIPRGLGRLVSTIIGKVAPSSPMGRTVYDVVFYEHLYEDDGPPIPRTGVDEALDLSLPPQA